MRAHVRFIESHMGGLGSLIYGVRDIAGKAWQSPDKYTLDDAGARATQLNAEFNHWGSAAGGRHAAIRPAAVRRGGDRR